MKYRAIRSFTILIELLLAATVFAQSGYEYRRSAITFVFFVSNVKGIHFSYERYLTNQIRETFGFDSVPLKLIFRKKR